MTSPDLGRLGIAGVIGMGLLLFCLSFYFGTLSPAQTSLDTLKRQEMDLRGSMAAFTEKASRSSAPDAVETLPRLTDAPELFRKLNALASANGVTIEHASYRLASKNNQRRIEINLPLAGTYPSIRAYLENVLLLSPVISLEGITLQRTKATDSQIVATAQLTFYLSNP